MEQTGIKEFEKAVVFFKQAIEKDPKFALAFSGLADTYLLIPDWGDFRAKDYMPQAKAAAQTALDLDPNLAEAHASLGKVLYDYEYDLPSAERSFKRAIELDPTPTTRQLINGMPNYYRKVADTTKQLAK